jgi:hypothetical protein
MRSTRRWSARDCPLGLARAKPMDVDFERCGDSRESVQGRDGDTTPPKVHFFPGDT